MCYHISIHSSPNSDFIKNPRSIFLKKRCSFQQTAFSHPTSLPTGVGPEATDPSNGHHRRGPRIGCVIRGLLWKDGYTRGGCGGLPLPPPPSIFARMRKSGERLRGGSPSQPPSERGSKTPSRPPPPPLSSPFKPCCPWLAVGVCPVCLVLSQYCVCMCV